MKIDTDNGPLSEEDLITLSFYLRKQPIPDNIHDFYYRKLNFCGCGNPDTQMQFLRDVLRAINRRSEGNTWKEDTKKIEALLPGALGQFYLYWLDSMGITEHGGSIGGDWLTEKGKELLLLMDTAPYNNVDPDAETNKGKDSW